MTPSRVWHDSFICVTWPIQHCVHLRLFMSALHVCDVTHSCLRHDWFTCVTCDSAFRKCDITHFDIVRVCICAWQLHFTCVTWLIRRERDNVVYWKTKRKINNDLQFVCVWHDWSVCVTWHMHICDMTHKNGIVCVIYACIMSHIRMSHVTHIRMSHKLLYACDMTHTKSCVCAHQPHFTCVTWLIRACDVTDSYAWHDAFIYVIWLIAQHLCVHISCTLCVWHDLFIRVTWLLHTCDMTHPYMWHESSIYVTWPIQHHVRVHVSRTSRVWHDSFIRATWFVRMRGMYTTC